MSAKHFYVYICYRPNGQPFYVGKGTGNRWRRSLDPEYISNKLNPYKLNILKKLLASGLSPECRIIAHFEKEEEAFSLEKLLIKQLGRYPKGPLTNLTDGGDGFAGLPKELKEKQHRFKPGHINTPQRNAKVSAALKGQPKSPEHISALRAAIARRPSRKGVPLSDEVRAKQSDGARARWERDKTPRAQRGPDGRFIDPDNPAPPVGLGIIVCPGCSREAPHRAQGLCEPCYARELAKTKRREKKEAQAAASVSRPRKPPKPPRPCASPGCTKTTTGQSRLFCNRHYRENLAAGNRTIIVPTEEQKTAMIGAYKDGESTYKIGVAADMNAEKVRWWLKKWDVPMRPPGFKRIYGVNDKRLIYPGSHD